MTKLHHATAKKALKAGITLSANSDDTWTATKDDITATHDDPKVLVDEMIRYLDGDEEFDFTIDFEGQDEVGDDEEGREGSGLFGGETRAKYKAKYRPFNDSNGDKLADRFMEAITDDEGRMIMGRFYQIASENGIDGHRWDHLNNGQKRMNLGNKMRAMLRRGEKVTIMGKEVKL